ncbi:bifunctional metallophosphatase/5'-nucleotidase [Neobacillus niacini]|uniref:bifunctional metallophosphatase/5'-nucleotidase n=1 Tax=Neobacillus niacini TaxID=86668 RepID=UPI00203E29E5|nr:5'-nucleotidase C-terminal domain-containing protein [Neobacillus niacini]MCM3691134.1 5'-nucleotidase C-terminal domain-containing protein [Neobacillus niacini]
MQWFYKILVSLLTVSLIACAANQNATDRNGANNQNATQVTDQSNNNNVTPMDVSQNNRGNVGTLTQNSLGNNQGLSEEYHGHIANRPETKQKKEKPPAANNRFIQVQLLGINDLHGQINVTRNVGGKPAGRADYLAAYLKQREAENKNTLLVQAGDMVGASPPASALLQDEPSIEILNKLGFDIGTVGNHEFDEGVKELLRLINGGTHEETGNFAGANFPWVAANVINQKTGDTILPPYKILKVNGMEIGFIGVVTTETPTIVVPSGVEGITFSDEVESINRNVAELKKQGVRSIVVLAHNPGTSGINGENPTGVLVDIANKVDDEVDIIFGGHNHAYMNATIDNKLIVQSYSYGTAFSDVDIEIDPKTKDIVTKRAEIITTFQEGIKPDPEIAKMVADYEATVEPIVNRVIGSTSVNLTALRNDNGESVLGDLIADAQRQALNTEIAFMNPGGIRADINPGDITWGEIYTVQPFNNDMVKMTMTGQQIRDVLNQQWGSKTTMLQISGFTYTWDENAPTGQKVVNIQLPDSTQLDPNKTYTVAANIFLAGGGDGFTVFTKAQNKEIGPVDLDVLVDFIGAQPKPFTYEIDNRIQKIRY